MVNMLKKKELAVEFLFLSLMERAENICSLGFLLQSPFPNLLWNLGDVIAWSTAADTDPALLCFIQPWTCFLVSSRTNISLIPYFT